MGADTDKPFTYRTIKTNKSNRYWLNTKYLIVILIVILILVFYLYTSREIERQHQLKRRQQEIDNYKIDFGIDYGS